MDTVTAPEISHLTRTANIVLGAVKKDRELAAKYGHGGWGERHAAAWSAPRDNRERSIVNMISAWLAYADDHRRRYESKIGDDGVLGEEWARIGYALRGLLNGELGRLDGGTTDSIILQALEAEDFDADLEKHKP